MENVDSTFAMTILSEMTSPKSLSCLLVRILYKVIILFQKHLYRSLRFWLINRFQFRQHFSCSFTIHNVQQRFLTKRSDDVPLSFQTSSSKLSAFRLVCSPQLVCLHDNTDLEFIHRPSLSIDCNFSMHTVSRSYAILDANPRYLEKPDANSIPANSPN